MGSSIADLETHVQRHRSEGVEIAQEIHLFRGARAVMIEDLDGLFSHLVQRY